MLKKSSCSLLLSILISLTAGGEGFRTPAAGGESLGRTGGRTIFAQGANAALQNPNNMLDEEQEALDLSLTVIDIQIHGTLSNGDTLVNDAQLKFMPTVNYVNPLPEYEKLSFGFGIYTPFGLSSNWETTGSFANPLGLRYQVPFENILKTIDFSPVISYQATEKLRVFVGLDLIWSQLEFNQFYPGLVGTAFPVTANEGVINSKGDDVAFTGKIGAMYNLTDKQFIYASYQHSYSMDYSGRTTVSNPLTPAASQAGVTASSSFDAGFDFPSIIKVGYGVQVTDRLQWEVQAEYIEFSRNENLDVDLGNNNVLLTALGASSRTPLNWKDTYTFGTTLTYQFEKLRVFGGYQFLESPVPAETYSTSIPDANQSAVSIGFTWENKGHVVSFGYSYVMYDDRTISNVNIPTLSGDFSTRVNLYSISYQYNF